MKLFQTFIMVLVLSQHQNLQHTKYKNKTAYNITQYNIYTALYNIYLIYFLTRFKFTIKIQYSLYQILQFSIYGVLDTAMIAPTLDFSSKLLLPKNS